MTFVDFVDMYLIYVVIFDEHWVNYHVNIWMTNVCLAGTNFKRIDNYPRKIKNGKLAHGNRAGSTNSKPIKELTAHSAVPDTVCGTAFPMEAVVVESQEAPVYAQGTQDSKL